MSQQTSQKPGRRTPLSLGQPKGDASDKSQVRASKATVNLEKLSTELLTKQQQQLQSKNGSTDERIDNNKTENQNASNNGSTTKKDGNGVHHIDVSVDNSKAIGTPTKPASDKSKQNEKVKEDKVAASPKVNEKEKAKSVNEKVANTNDKQRSPNDNVAGLSKIDEKVDAKNGNEKEVRESVRQKQIREEKEKEESVKVTSNNQPTKVNPSTPDKNSESSKVKEKRKLEATTPTKTPKTLPSESLLAEKSLKGFNENLEEAESSKITDSPMPAKEGKVLKYSQAAPLSASRNKRSEKLDEASLVVNLSTVSELSNESNSTPVERSYSLRHITGRRSTRPLREISFDFRMRESYYKDRNELSDSISNTNVTNGSDSPRVSGVGQSKRNIDDDDTASPKRSRFDFGLLEFVSSPVKKLGAKFSRSTLSTSTPNKLIATEDVPSGIEAEHFAAEEDDLATIELNPSSVDADADEKKMEIDTEHPPAEKEAPIIEVHEPSKSRCVLM